jgi:hypothetical protein
MLRLDNGHTGVLLDLGWYGDEQGEYRLEARPLVIPGTAEMWRSPPLRELRSRSHSEVVQTLNDWLGWYSIRHATRQPR